jgi:serine/threonine protein kinase
MQKKIENYILQREIGSGCFGVVYKGKHAETG